MTKLTLDQINELKNKGFITHTEPSTNLANNTVDELKNKGFVTSTDPSADVEDSISSDVPVTGVTIEGPADPIDIGHEASLGIIVKPEDATNRNVTVVSSDESVATVSFHKDEWNVTGVDSGSTTLTVTTEDGGFTDTCEVVVVSK